MQTYTLDQLRHYQRNRKGNVFIGLSVWYRWFLPFVYSVSHLAEVQKSWQNLYVPTGQVSHGVSNASEHRSIYDF